MWERIKRYALYGDTDRESYNAVKGKIEASNGITALVFASVASVLIGIMFCLSFFLDGLKGTRGVYEAGVLFSLFQVAVALAARKHPSLSYVSVYLAVSVFLLYGISIGTLTRPEEQTVTFMVMLIFVPLIFVDRPIRMAGSLLFYIILFIVLALRTKKGAVLGTDIADACIFGLLSIISESVINRVKIRGYVLEHRLHIMSETDQLTGLNNRNCYESRLEAYGERHNIACVYIDVNGLHELNNTKGHKAGDEMLIYVADVVRDIFGREDTYRIGGDEYVAFAIGQSESEVEAKIAQMKQRVQARGYHTAVGHEHSQHRSMDIAALISSAEAKMYRDKAEFYSTHDRRRR